MNFNEDQLKAINAPLNQNLMISAGAGSGKTATLTEKVYNLINTGSVDPSKLLVLTFTDKAAYEMKTRIISKFKKEGSDFANRILSSHIQTFDSFSKFLVDKYANMLGVSPNITIMAEDKNLANLGYFLDLIIKQHYDNNDQAFILTAKKFIYKNDSSLKQIIISMYKRLSTLSLKQKDIILNSYNDEYLTKEAYKDSISKRRNEIKTIIEEAYHLGVSYFENCLPYDKPKKGCSIDKSIDTIKECLEINSNLDASSELTSLIEGMLSEIFDLCSKLDEEFFNGLLAFDLKECTVKKIKQKNEYDSKIMSSFKNFIVNIQSKSNIFRNINEQLSTIIDHKDDAEQIIKIYKEVDEMMWKYKIKTNSFVFNDISNMALKLLCEEKYKDIANEIRNDFEYVMVDEYQDTNNQQEAFINSLTQNCPLFVVGDVKQSIYRFRYADCQLFLNREAKYTPGDSLHQVIKMNQNYRSTEKIIKDINNLFDKIMTVETNSINYLNEHLSYGASSPQFSLLNENGHYGLNILHTKNIYKTKIVSDDMIAPTIEAIALDILNKINSKYMVVSNSKGKELRPCTYSDFAIIVSTHKKIDSYKEIFEKYNIPLNFNISENLYEVNALLTLNSIIKYINYKVNGEEINLKHIYLSLSRSYLFFDGDDGKLHQNLMDKSYLSAKFFKELDAFAELAKTQPFSIIFEQILDYFGVIDKLNTLGNVDNNMSKIEFLRSSIKNFEDSGEGLKEFALFSENLQKFKVDHESEDLYDGENCVEFTTIHKSKGLEYKIVYIPCCDTHPYRKDNRKSEVLFSKNYGFYLSTNEIGKITKTFNGDLISKEDEEANSEEYLRLVYVALTRAKESVYFVDSYDNVTDTIPNFDQFPFKIVLNSRYFEFFIKTNLLSSYQLNEIKNIVEEVNKNSEKVYRSFTKVSFDSSDNDIQKAKNVDLFLNGFCNICLKEVFIVNVNRLLQEKNIDISGDQNFAFLLAKKDYYGILHQYFGFNERPYYKEYYGFNTFRIDENEDIKVSDFVENTKTINIDNTHIESEHISTQKASSHTSQIEDIPADYEQILKKGTHLHYLLELVDLKTKSVSFIKNSTERNLISNVLELDLFNDSDLFTPYHEYGYIDDKGQSGFIDLLLVSNSKIKIIDFKTQNIDDPQYVSQLETYKTNIEKLFKQPNIECYLLSIVDCRYKKVFSPIDKLNAISKH